MNTLTTSVAICTCNGARYIEGQLNSIIYQVYPVDEIILCDDCSDDATVEIARQILRKSGIAYTIVRNESRLGVTSNFEQAIRLCTKKVIFTSDQDDLWDVNKVKRMLECFAVDSNCVMAFSDATVIDGNGQRIRDSLYEKDGFMQNGHDYRNYLDDILRLNYTVYGCTMAVRKDFIESIVPFFQSKANHDAWIMCCAGAFGNIRYISEALISYRIHGANCVGTLAGNPKWEGIIANRDRYDRYFAIHKLRALRIRLLEEILRRYDIRNAYTAECRRCIEFYKGLLQVKERGMSGCWFFLRSMLNGSYVYRFCDRGVKISPAFMLKQFVNDILFLIKWRNQ